MTTQNKLSRVLSVLLIAAAFCASAFGATALTTTTLTYAIPASTAQNQQNVVYITVGSATGIVAAPTQPAAQGGLGGPTGSVATFLYIDRELMQVNSISGTTIGVQRGVQGTPATPHAANAVVYIGTGRAFVNRWSEVTGACQSAYQPAYTPYIDPATGLEYACPSTGVDSGNWVVSGQTSSYGVSTSNLNPNTIQFVSVPLTAAQINTIYTTPISVIPAQGAGTLIEVQSCVLDLKYGSAAFTSGGTVTIGYGTTQATVAASTAAATIASTVLTTFSASQSILVAGSYPVTANTLSLNTAVSITNGTGVFATGTGATAVLDCAYRVHSGF